MKKKEKTTVPTEMITPEMREAGIDEETPMLTRDEMVADLGEELVADIEKEALEHGSVVKGSYTVVDMYGKFVRTYDVETHGLKASELARQFALKIKGEVR